MHFRLDFFMEANNMNPDQTAPNGGSLIWVHIICNTNYLRIYTDERAENKRHDWQNIFQLIAANNFCKQLGPRSGPTNVGPDQDPNCLTL